MQSQPVSSPKERKFQVLVICDAAENKPGFEFTVVLVVLGRPYVKEIYEGPGLTPFSSFQLRFI